MTTEPARGMRAVVLAGGKGVRLRPFTANFPKPLMPLGDVPIIEILLTRLIAFGITDVTLTLGHLAELIQAYFLHRKELTQAVRLSYVIEDQPTGTAGSLAAVEGLDRPFLVMNGDLLTDLNFDDLVAFHGREGAALTIATHRRHVKIDYGVLHCGADRTVTGYTEKPDFDYDVSMGIYVYEPRVLRFIRRGEYLDFPDLVLKLIEAGEKVVAYKSDCFWLDIGRPDDYADAQEIYAKQKDRLLARAADRDRD